MNELSNSQLNETVEQIFNLDKGFSENKNGQTSKKTDLSTLVVPRGQPYT